MSFLELAKKRYSVREYLDAPVEEEKLRQVLEAARIAPTAKNLQPFSLIVARDEGLRGKIARAYALDWIARAPVIIVVCGDHSRSWRRADGKDHCDIDAAIVIDHMTLAATDLGLGTCWVCAFNSAECHKALGLPPHLETIALLPLGYPADRTDPERHQERRKKLEELVHWDGFSR